MGFESIDQPSQHQKLNIIQIWAFHYLAKEGWQMGFKSIYQPSQPSEVECNPKMSISFFWLERGGRWGLSPSTNLADHQKLNIIQKWAFHFFGWRGVVDGVRVHWPAWPIIRSERNPKMSIPILWLERGSRWGSSLLTSQADYQKLNIIQKWAFYIFGWRGVVDGVQVHWPSGQSSEVESNPKWAFLYFGWRGVADGVRVHQPTQLIIRSWM